jgi:uncharacterized protein (TIGR00645 family)
MSEASAPHPRSSSVKRLIERTMFGSRWLLAPFYLGLILGLVMLLVKFAQQTIGLLASTLTASGNDVIVAILSLIDLSLMANLLLMVVFAGYESFVSRLDVEGHAAQLDWMGQIGFGDLKLKLMASIVAISAIHVLEEFMNVGHVTNRDLAWIVGIHPCSSSPACYWLSWTGSLSAATSPAERSSPRVKVGAGGQRRWGILARTASGGRDEWGFPGGPPARAGGGVLRQAQ